MSDLSTFAEHVQDVLSNSFRELHWTPSEAAQYMADIATRRQTFENLANQLNETILKPRLDIVTNLFPNATRSVEQQPHSPSSLDDVLANSCRSGVTAG